MSGFVRTIQRTVKRKGEPHYFGRGSRLGVTNDEAVDALAREAREAKRRQG